jgi:hypothetical protein
VRKQRKPLSTPNLRRLLPGVAALALAGLSGLLGCERSDKPHDVDVQYGDAVGIRIEGAHLAPYQVVFAVDEGADVRPLVQPLSSLVHMALLACPGASAPSTVARTMILSFAVDGGQLRRGRSGAPDGTTTPGESCLLERLDGRPLASDAPPRHLLLQLHLEALAPDAAPAPEVDGAR